MDEAALSCAINWALQEDLGSGDVTSYSILPRGLQLTGEIGGKEKSVLAGLGVARPIFQRVGEKTVISCFKSDGERIRPGDTLAKVEGQGTGILGAERLALNFLRRMSGIATMPRRYMEETVPGCVTGAAVV